MGKIALRSGHDDESQAAQAAIAVRWNLSSAGGIKLN